MKKNRVFKLKKIKDINKNLYKLFINTKIMKYLIKCQKSKM